MVIAVRYPSAVGMWTDTSRKRSHPPHADAAFPSIFDKPDLDVFPSDVIILLIMHLTPGEHSAHVSCRACLLSSQLPANPGSPTHRRLFSLSQGTVSSLIDLSLQGFSWSAPCGWLRALHARRVAALASSCLNLTRPGKADVVRTVDRNIIILLPGAWLFNVFFSWT